MAKQAKKKKRKVGIGVFFTFVLAWTLMALILPLNEIWGLALATVISGLLAFVVGKRSAKKQIKLEEEMRKEEEALLNDNLSPIVTEANRALREMAKLYSNIKDADVKLKINELMRITDKIMQNAVADPDDITQTKKFLNYYLPTTIKLLHSYDRMSSQGIEGETLDKTMKNINEMLDEAIEAFKKRLDSMFENQALDIETDIEVMNTMLAREGLSSCKDFRVETQKGS